MRGRIVWTILILALAGASVLLLGANFRLGQEIEGYRMAFGDVQEVVETQEETIQDQGDTIHGLRTDIERQDDALLEMEARLGKLEEVNKKLTSSKKGSYFMVGYSAQLDEGVVNPIEVEITHGTGRVLLDTRGMAVDKYAQTSMTTAYQVAKRVTGADLNDKDVTFTVINPFDFSAEMEGPSAGAAMCLLLISVLEDRTIRDGYLITGQIKWNGTIGEVGLIPQKLGAANESNASVLMVPVGNAIEVEGMEIIEVADIQEVMELALG